MHKTFQTLETLAVDTSVMAQAHLTFCVVAT